MRSLAFCAILLAACRSTKPPGHAGGRRDEPLPLTKVVFRQYYPGSPVFILESLSGRDMVQLRSHSTHRRGVKLAYVPDDVMERLLADFHSFGFDDYAGARPPDPRKVGGRAELTIITGEHRHMTAFIRRNGQGKTAYLTYRQCLETFRAVHAHFGRFQATTTNGDFGVRRAEFGGR